MKSFIGIILISYVFLLIYSEDSSENYDDYITNNETAYKAANFCLEYYNKKHKNESYILTNVTVAINETLDSNSDINLMFKGNETNSGKEQDFQGIFKPGTNGVPKCDVVVLEKSKVDIATTLPQVSTTIRTTIKPVQTTKKPSKKTTKKAKGKEKGKGKGKGKKNKKGKKTNKKSKKNSKNSKKKNKTH